MNDTIHRAILQGFGICKAANLSFPPKAEEAATWARNWTYLFEQGGLTDPETIGQRFLAWAGNEVRFPNAPNIINLKMSAYVACIGTEPRYLPEPKYIEPTELGRAHLHYQSTRIPKIGEGQGGNLPKSITNEEILAIYREECAP